MLASTSAFVDDAENPNSKPYDLLTTDVLPTGRIALVGPIKGKAERAFFETQQSKDALTLFKGWNDLLMFVVLALDGAPPTRDMIMELDDADRRAVLLMARRRTFSSPIVEFKWRCAPPWVAKAASCNKYTESGVDLSTMVYLPVPAAPVPMELPKLKKKVSVERPTGYTTEAYFKLRKGRETTDHTDMMVARKVRIDGELASQVQLDDLDGEDRMIIKRLMNSPYGPDSKVECVCSHCGSNMKTFLELIPGFFFPGQEM